MNPQIIDCLNIKIKEDLDNKKRERDIMDENKRREDNMKHEVRKRIYEFFSNLPKERPFHFTLPELLKERMGFPIIVVDVNSIGFMHGLQDGQRYERKILHIGYEGQQYQSDYNSISHWGLHQLYAIEEYFNWFESDLVRQYGCKM